MSVPEGLTFDDVRKAAVGAFARWTSAVDGAIDCVFDAAAGEDAAPGDGINTIQFSVDWSRRGYDPSAAGITDIIYVRDLTGTWAIAEADIYLNAEHHRWSRSGTGDERNLASVLTHEAGHFLGLMHPCELRGGGADGAPACGETSSFVHTAMHPVYSAEQENLTADDEAGLVFLYGAEACEEGTCLPGSVCMEDGCREECESMICAVGEHCTADGCWPDDKCYGPECDLACQYDADCAPGQRCRSNRCRGLVPVGGRCGGPTDCETALCADEGFCLGSCDDCAPGSCRVASDGTGTCQSAKGPIGTACIAPEDCLGGQCLTGTADGQVCTFACVKGLAQCPMGWACGTVRGRDVCVPEEVHVAGGGGCSMPSGMSRRSTWESLALAAALGRVVRRRFLGLSSRVR